MMPVVPESSTIEGRNSILTGKCTKADLKPIAILLTSSHITMQEPLQEQSWCTSVAFATLNFGAILDVYLLTRSLAEHKLIFPKSILRRCCKTHGTLDKSVRCMASDQLRKVMRKQLICDDCRVDLLANNTIIREAAEGAVAEVTVNHDTCHIVIINQRHSFANLCNHEDDFGLKVISHNFFTTSHGKNPCDGIGAIAKRSTRRASLQSPLDNQILHPRQMFDYLDTHVSKIRFLYVDGKDVEARENKLKQRFSSAKAVPNTRKHHCFRPIDKVTLEIKLYSSDKDSNAEKVKIS